MEMLSRVVMLDLWWVTPAAHVGSLCAMLALMLEAVPCNPCMRPLDRAIMLTVSIRCSCKQLLLHLGAFHCPTGGLPVFAGAHHWGC